MKGFPDLPPIWWAGSIAMIYLAIGSIERVIANHILRRPRDDRVVSGLVLEAQNTDRTPLQTKKPDH
jgi:hypothetical protein